MASRGSGSGAAIIIAILLAAMALAGGFGAASTFSKLHFGGGTSQVQQPGKPTCVPSPNLTVMPTC